MRGMIAGILFYVPKQEKKKMKKKKKINVCKLENPVMYIFRFYKDHFISFHFVVVDQI